SALVKIGNASGSIQITAAAGSASASFTVNVTATGTGIQIVSGNSQTAVISTAFASPLVVKVVNAQGAGVPGVQVTFAVTSGSATLGSATATTDSSGQASTAVTA